MRLVNEKIGRSDSGNVLNEIVIAFHCFHTVDEYAGVGDENRTPSSQTVRALVKERRALSVEFLE